MIKRYALIAALVAVSAGANTALAAASADEVAKLGTTLTPFGAEKSGNKEGTIPAWTGGETKVPAGLKGNAKRADIFASEKPLFSITAQNYAKYEDKLTDGQIALFKKFPDYRMDVYPTHRTAAAPQWVYDNTLKNAKNATLTEEGSSVKGAYGGIPFPIAKSGAEAMWNHLLRWRGTSAQFPNRAYVTSSDGKRYLVTDAILRAQSPYYMKDGPKSDYRDEYDILHMKALGPPQMAGQAIASRDSLDLKTPSSLWLYLTGQRRVRKLPVSSYDTPAPIVSGVSNNDEFYVFRGALDRYDWTLAGKKEVFIPYNNNGFSLPAKDEDVLMSNFANPNNVRWELHRVWVVDASVGAGKRHVMPKRRFYLDEDTWTAQLSDGWDASGKLWKTFVMMNYVAPDLPGVVTGPFVATNLQTGDWVIINMANQASYTIDLPAKPWPDSDFTGDALMLDGVR
ncbi:Protein of unknown function [Variovorax sp. YR752]|uniref:DUF1329 domain-containing protein n=1 Tax=Variovorax sp. YR752 TaxID=1884383 RepID=UPI000BCF870D|nr:DUF1329 domain-containing protein [Variovorax sp. YR752]SOE06289.1 Protein of unknown function [Variovorax sp. YR752]